MLFDNEHLRGAFKVSGLKSGLKDQGGITTISGYVYRLQDSLLLGVTSRVVYL